MGNVSTDHERAGKAQPGLYRVAAQLVADRIHGLIQIDGDNLVAQFVLGCLGKEAGRIGFELLEEDALGSDLCPGLTIGRAAHGECHRVGRAVPGQPDHANVMTEVLAPELGTDPEPTGLFEDALFPLEVAEAMTGCSIARGRERIEVVGRCVLCRLQRELGRRAADDEGEMIGRTGRRADRAK